MDAEGRSDRGRPRLSPALSPSDTFVWSVEPAVSLNDLAEPGHTVFYSRARITDNGTFAWSGTDPVTDVTVSYEWRQCDACPVAGTASKYVVEPNGGDEAATLIFVDVVVDANVQNSGGPTHVSVHHRLPLGQPAVSTAAPSPVVDPTIFLTPGSPSEVTGTKGEWTIEHFNHFVYFMRCVNDTDIGTCSYVTESAPNSDPEARYTRNASDIGLFTRFQVVADAYSGDPADRVSFTTGPVGPYAGVPDDTTTTTQPPTPVSSTNDHIAVGSSLPNSTSITLTGSGTGEGALSYLWTQTSGPPVIDPLGVAGATVTLTTPATGSGSLTFDFEVTDSLNQVATSSATVAYFSSAVPALLCEFFDATQTTGSHTLSLGSTMEMSFTTATATTGTCDDTTRVDVTGATMSLFGWFHLDITTVAVTKTAITISGATLTASDGSLGTTQFSLVGTAQIPLSVAGGDLEFEGSVRASALPFVSLPAPWAGTAQIDLTTAGDGSQAIAFHGSAADGGASVEIDGAMATDRTFSLSVVGTDLISIRGLRCRLRRHGRADEPDVSDRVRRLRQAGRAGHPGVGRHPRFARGQLGEHRIQRGRWYQRGGGGHPLPDGRGLHRDRPKRVDDDPGHGRRPWTMVAHHGSHRRRTVGQRHRVAGFRPHRRRHHRAARRRSSSGPRSGWRPSPCTSLPIAPPAPVHRRWRWRER